ncbi:MAG: four helix bundle protein [Candidatus Marinimicrobia bacterium]|nr:four helix bundle protein [Candidatus Neomarinimicrobiota bacterium]
MNKDVGNFEKLEVWQKSCQLSVSIFKLFDNCKYFGLKDQVLRSSVSIPSNIAEGSERGSKKDFIRFLCYSKGSAAELLTQIYISYKIGYITDTDKLEIISEIRSISKMLQGLINSLNRQQPITDNR